MTLADRRNTGLLRWSFTRRLHDLAGKAYRAELGVVFRLILIVAIGVFPVIHDFHHMEGTWWLTGWVVVFIGREIGVSYLNGLGSQNRTKKLARINRDLGGNIDSIARKVVPDAGKKMQRLSDMQAHAICMSLLARVLDITLNQYANAEQSDIRVTLAVPLKPNGFTQPIALRIWCYDRPHDDSHWTELPLPVAKEVPCVGAPDAFVSNETRIVRDIRTTPGIAGVETRRYRSIVSIPVPAGGPSGKPCAVLNIDAATQGFFTEDIVWERILPLSAPILSAISFVLRLRSPGIPFEFGN